MKGTRIRDENPATHISTPTDPYIRTFIPAANIVSHLSEWQEAAAS